MRGHPKCRRPANLTITGLRTLLIGRITARTNSAAATGADIAARLGCQPLADRAEPPSPPGRAPRPRDDKHRPVSPSASRALPHRPQARPGVQEHRLLTGTLLTGMLVPAAAQIIRVWSVTAAQVSVC